MVHMDGTQAQQEAHHALFAQLAHIAQSQVVVQPPVQVDIIRWLDGLNAMFAQ